MLEDIMYIYGAFSEEEALELDVWDVQSAGNQVLFDKAEKVAINNRGTIQMQNTFTTTDAGQFEVLLPDGSKVWLNNVSSFRYPAASAERVELKREAYFEIALTAASHLRFGWVIRWGRYRGTCLRFGRRRDCCLEKRVVSF